MIYLSDIFASKSRMQKFKVRNENQKREFVFFYFALYVFTMAVKIPKIRKRTSLRSKLVALAAGIGALAAIAFLAVSNWRIYETRQGLDAQIQKLQEQIQVLNERRDTLKAGLSAAQGDSFQEEKMREQGYKKPGEEVIAVLQDGSTSATKQSEPATGDSFWTDLWGKIKNIKQ